MYENLVVFSICTSICCALVGWVSPCMETRKWLAFLCLAFWPALVMRLVRMTKHRSFLYAVESAVQLTHRVAELSSRLMFCLLTLARAVSQYCTSQWSGRTLRRCCYLPQSNRSVRQLRRRTFAEPVECSAVNWAVVLHIMHRWTALVSYAEVSRLPRSLTLKSFPLNVYHCLCCSQLPLTLGLMFVHVADLSFSEDCFRWPWGWLRLRRCWKNWS